MKLIADKIKFRYHIQNWRLQNNFYMLTSCSGASTMKNISPPHSQLITSTPPISLGHQPNLENILKDTVDGNDIFKKYENLNCLQETDQSTIVRIVVDNYIKRDIKMTPATMKNVANQIVKLFPTEQESVYYIPRTNKKKRYRKIV